MEDTSKYLIHAEVTADGVVERSDVVGAIFGQTEGLLGDDLDLRDLRESHKVGRIDVEVSSSGGSSTGEITIATGLDKVETATLAAALETISRIGPCRAELTVRSIEDVRSAKRKEVVDRATELLRTGFEDSVMSSEEILTEVREQVRVEDITSYEGLPAGPRVTDSDAIILVEGRSDVMTLLKYGIKNAIAVEGTDVPEAVSELTRHRTVTAFLDGDRGGDLIFKELTQVAEIDHVAFAPNGRAVEDLEHHEVFAALQEKAPIEEVAEETDPRETITATDGTGVATVTSPEPVEPEVGAEEPAAESVYDHVDAVIRAETDRVRLVDDSGAVLTEAPADEVYETIGDSEPVPSLVVLDAILDQRVLDLAAERGVDRIVARSLGQFTKQPAAVAIHAASDIAASDPTEG